jgi:hypothetical protein
MVKINSKAQVGETLTWIVATILVVVLLIFFIFGSSLLSGTKKVSDTFRESLTSGQVQEGNDVFLQKSLFAYASIGSVSTQLELDKILEKMTLSGNFTGDYNQTKKEVLLNYNLK